VEALAWIIGSALGIIVFVWWSERRWQRVNSYYEYEHQDLPIFDTGPRLNGDRGTR
jgi:hypothetical protein